MRLFMCQIHVDFTSHMRYQGTSERFHGVRRCNPKLYVRELLEVPSLSKTFTELSRTFFAEIYLKMFERGIKYVREQKNMFESKIYFCESKKICSKNVCEHKNTFREQKKCFREENRKYYRE